MNQNILKVFEKRKHKQNIDIGQHLWKMLETLATNNNQEILKGTSYKQSNNIFIQFSPAGERARKVVRRSNYRMTGKFPSTKNGRMLHWESKYEQMAFQILEIAPFILSFQEQPAVFKFKNKDQAVQTHFPDLLVTLKNGLRLFIEIKSDIAREDEPLLERTALLQALVQEMSYRYLLIYPEQLISHEYLANAQLILKHRCERVPFPIKEKIKQFLFIQGHSTFESLNQMLCDQQAKTWIFKLIIEGLIFTDLSISFSNETRLALAGSVL